MMTIEQLVKAESGSMPGMEALLARFLRSSGYDRRFALELIATGKTRSKGNWDVRCLAALMLETQFLRIPAGSIAEQQFLLEAAGCPNDGPFVRGLRRRLRRLNYVHRQVRGELTTREAVLDFLHVATQPCRIWFARYFFGADEITGRILDSVRTSRGMKGGLPEGAGWPAAVRNHLARLPGLEQQVAAALSGKDRLYWVAQTTPSRINNLVEYPVGTVALVIKPPGSDLEFEIKRVGIRGPNALSAVFSRGAKVPWPHRLQGGSVGCMVDSEARATFRIAALYRAIHGTEAPASFVLEMNSVYTVPGCAGEADLLSYFTERADFGDDFDQMRGAISQCVEDFENGKPDMDLPGDLGLTVRFLRHLAPKQAIVSGTSSFRLNAVGRYLSPEGPDLYFRRGLQRDYSPTDGRQLADDLLAEVLGLYLPPPVQYVDHRAYVAAALQVPANRLRADRTYLSLMRQIGRFWGTLAGLGAHSRGEAFAARNAGLRSQWIQGRWRVRICFLDHDNTWVPWKDSGELDPAAMLDGMKHDARYIFHESFSVRSAPGEVGCLRQIYQPGSDVAAAGAEALAGTLRRYSRKTRACLKKSPDLRRLIDPAFLRTKADWDGVVRSWIRDGGQLGTVSDEWLARARHNLVKKGYDEKQAGRYVNALKKDREFLSKFDFLFL